MREFIAQQLQQYIEDRQNQGLYRSRMISTIAADKLDFSCNDYLSLTQDDRVKQAYQHGFRDYPAGSGGSMVLCGYHAEHRLLEQAFATALGADDGLLFSSGYVANLAVVGFLAKFGAHLLIDKAVHASVYDGLSLAGAKYTRFLHHDYIDLANKLQQSPEHTVVLTESIFSMSGLCPPLAKISGMVSALGFGLVVDEAHGFGVLGPQGLGGVVAAGLTQDEVPLRVIPFGKALGGSGAIVVGQALWIDALLQATRPAIYSTAISPAFAFGLRSSLGFLCQADDRRAHLQALIQYFRAQILSSGLTWRDSGSPIQQLQLGCPFLADHYAQRLENVGIRCFPIRQPTVPKQETGLRVILNYHHQYQDIDRLFEVLQS